MPDDVIKKKEEDEKDSTADEKKKLEAEKEELKQNKLNFKREQYIALGGTKALADKIDSISNLDALIEHQKGITKKNDAPLEAKKIKVTAGKPTVTFPDGNTSVMKPVMNSGPNNIYHFIDPTKVPRNNVLWNSRARINFLPPDNEHPYNRVIA